jgi:hypothetical protein
MAPRCSCYLGCEQVHDRSVLVGRLAASAGQPLKSSDADAESLVSRWCPGLAGEVVVSAKLFDFSGEPVGIRTRDLLIKSQLLCRLSYGLAAAPRT